MFITKIIITTIIAPKKEEAVELWMKKKKILEVGMHVQRLRRDWAKGLSFILYEVWIASQSRQSSRCQPHPSSSSMIT